MFKVLIGDLFESRAQALVNTVNCVGVMGKGVAEQFKTRFPQMFEDYVRRCAEKRVRLGEPYLYEDLSGRKIICFPTKNHWRSPSRISDIESGLDYLVAHVQHWSLKSIAMPPLGCGNGGLSWAEVGPLIYRKLVRLPLTIELFAPFGTPRQQLTEEFLSSPAQMSLDDKGRRHEKMPAEWAVLVEVLRQLEQQPYASPVGRVIFQKICYLLTEMGVNTGFDFTRGHYGPFSDSVKLALHDFANRNWIHEQPLGRMVALRVCQQYERDRGKYAEMLEKHQRQIAKTVDLFSRIKSTEQAEEVLTVLFASRQIKQEKRDAEVAEQDLYDYILAWKKTWNTDEKRHAVASAIRNLVLLGWMRARISEDLEDLLEVS